VKHTLGKKDNPAATNMTVGAHNWNFLGHMVVDTHSAKKNSNGEMKSASNSPPLNSYPPLTQFSTRNSPENLNNARQQNNQANRNQNPQIKQNKTPKFLTMQEANLKPKKQPL
jgi:hypothetical protein